MPENPLEQELLARAVGTSGKEEAAPMHDDPIVNRALGTLSKSINPEQLNPIQVIDSDDYDRIRLPKALHKPTSGVVAFRVWRGAKPDEPIYVNRTSNVYKLSDKEPRNRWADLQLASVLAHEQVHNTERGEIGEGAAMRKQADYIRSMFDTLNSQEKQQAMQYLNATEQHANRLLKRKSYNKE